MDALRTMVVGIELGSFTRAASQLGRSQSSVSMQLKKLERQAGRPLFRRNGRGVSPTEDGDTLLAYARRIISLNDEAAALLGARAAVASVRIGIPQDFAEDILPEVIKRFVRNWPEVHVEARAGRNYTLEDDVRTGRVDVALYFLRPGAKMQGRRITTMPLLWLGTRDCYPSANSESIPLVLFDHPCLFRQTALETLEAAKFPLRVALTTPSLPGVWAALRSGLGISIRTAHRVPAGISDVGPKLNLPALPSIDLRVLAWSELSPAASDLRDILFEVACKQIRTRNAGSQ
jgi:DNA-binding transcriptional LysR family regulator